MCSRSLARACREHKSADCAVFANMRTGCNWCLTKTLGIHLFQTVFHFHTSLLLTLSREEKMESVALILDIWKSQQSLLPVWQICKSASALDSFRWKIIGNAAKMVKRSCVIDWTHSQTEREFRQKLFTDHWRVKRSQTMWSRAFQQISPKHWRNFYSFEQPNKPVTAVAISVNSSRGIRGWVSFFSRMQHLLLHRC